MVLCDITNCFPFNDSTLPQNSDTPSLSNLPSGMLFLPNLNNNWDGPYNPMDPCTFPSSSEFSGLDEVYPSIDHLIGLEGDYSCCFHGSTNTVEPQSDSDAPPDASSSDLSMFSSDFNVFNATTSDDGLDNNNNDNDDGCCSTDAVMVNTSHWCHATATTNDEGNKEGKC